MTICHVRAMKPVNGTGELGPSWQCAPPGAPAAPKGDRGDLHHRSCALHELRAGGLRSGRESEEERMSRRAHVSTWYVVLWAVPRIRIPATHAISNSGCHMFSSPAKGSEELQEELKEGCYRCMA